MESRICVFKVAIVSADNVWSASAGKEGSKAAVSLHFPGQDAATLYQSDAVLPSPLAQDNASSITDAAPPDDPKTSIDAKKDRGKENPCTTSEVSSSPVSFSLKAFSDYVRASDWLLWHHLVTDPLVISLLWISSSSQTVTAVGRVAMDLSELLFSKDLCWERECILEPVISAEQETATSKKDALQKAPSKAKKTNAMDEVPPSLSQGASVKVQITLDTPILSQDEREEGILLDFSKFCVERVPPQYAEINGSVASYSLAFEIPGFSGMWWSSFSTVKQEVKQSLGVARIHGGLVTLVPLEPTGTAEEATDSGKSENLPALATITWNASLRRFLPGAAARELKENIWKKQTWHGEIARYNHSGQSAPPFERDHLSVDLDLCSLLEEGVSESRICSALEIYTTNHALLRENVNSGSKIDSGNESSYSINPWQACSSQLTICIKTSRPLQPAWVAPPKPELTLQDVLTLRPKLPTSLDKLEIALGEFRDLVYAGAQSIFCLQEKVVSDDTSSLMSKAAVWADRAELKEKLRQLLSSELIKTGTWHNLKEEMKQRIIKIACEKLRLSNESLKDMQYVFYNSLYVHLMEIIHNSIGELDSKRKEGFLNFSEGLETGASKQIHTKEHWRQLADEYEADGDYVSATKCYEEIISAETKSPDLWLQYGLFLMRGTRKDHGKAEECFREALNLRQDHPLGLLTLACLMWHRSSYLEAEVLLNMIIDLHLQEEVIAWVLLGQICLHASDRSRDSGNCFSRAESLRAAWKDMRISTSHDLNSSLLKHPFSLSHAVLKCCIPSNPYVDTALLLLDLHLPKEAEAILSQEHAVFSCNIEYKLCLGRVQELLGEYTEAEKLTKEAWGSDYTQATVWMLLGHLYHKSSQYKRAIDAYEKMVEYGEEQPFFVLGCLELGKSYLHCHQFDKAKNVFLQLSTSHPSCSSWLGAGMSFYEEGDMVCAEAALVEGNILDPWNFKVWAYLALVCLRTNRIQEAEFAFDQAMQLHPFLPLVVQMAECFYERGNIRVADKALQKAYEEAAGACDSKLMWSGCWQEKLSLVKRVLENTQNSTRQELVSLEFNPIKALSDKSIVDIAIYTESLSDTNLKELKVLSSL